jgi:hypothetical protein
MAHFPASQMPPNVPATPLTQGSRCVCGATLTIVAGGGTQDFTVMTRAPSARARVEVQGIPLSHCPRCPKSSADVYDVLLLQAIQLRLTGLCAQGKLPASPVPFDSLGIQI